jgi:hypothetical protein
VVSDAAIILPMWAMRISKSGKGAFCLEIFESDSMYSIPWIQMRHNSPGPLFKSRQKMRIPCQTASG